MTTSPARRARETLFVMIASATFAAGGDGLAQVNAARTAGCVRASSAIEVAVREREAGHIDAALAVLEDLYTRCPTPQVTAQLALAESDARRLTRAWAHLQAALAQGDDPWVRSRRAALVVARTELRARMATLSVRTGAAGAELYVDGERLGPASAPEAYLIGAGTLRVELRAPGYPPVEREVTAGAGQAVVVDLPMVLPAPVAVSLRAAPAAARIAPAQGARTARYVGYGLLGLGAASAATGVAFAVISAMQAAALGSATSASPGAEGAFVRFVTAPGYTATDRSTDTACAAAAADASADGRAAAGHCADQSRARVLAWVFGIAGAAAAGAGVALVLLRPGESGRAAALWVTPAFGSTTGVLLHGAF